MRGSQVRPETGLSYPDLERRMKGKVVLITGASSGIGAGTAVLFASRGCLLSLTGRNQEGLRDTQQACIQAGAKEDDILLIAADLQAQESLTEIIDKTVHKFGRLDVLVNNAGCLKLSVFKDVNLEEFNTVMDTNVKALFFLTQKALPHLIQSKGNVVNVSSVGSRTSRESSIVYRMSKAAVDHFTRIAALDLAPKGVRVNAVNPGGVRTQIFEKSGYLGSIEELEQRAKKVHALGRGGTVEEIAKAIAFLADEEQSSFITGETLLVDGGLVLKGPL